VFSGEIPVLLREHGKGLYRVDAYFVAKNLADTPLFIITPILFLCIFYYMANLNEDFERFIVCIALMILIVQAAVALGMELKFIQPGLSAFLRRLRVLSITEHVGGFGRRPDHHHSPHQLRRVLPKRGVSKTLV